MIIRSQNITIILLNNSKIPAPGPGSLLKSHLLKKGLNGHTLQKRQLLLPGLRGGDQAARYDADIKWCTGDKSGFFHPATVKPRAGALGIVRAKKTRRGKNCRPKSAVGENIYNHLKIQEKTDVTPVIHARESCCRK